MITTPLRNLNLYLARHAKAIKLKPEDRDIDRVLNNVGIDQSQALASLLGPDFNPDKVIISGLKRTEQTAQAIMKGREISVVKMGSLFWVPNEEGQKKCDALFAQLSYAPPKDYLEHEDGDVVREFGEIGAQDLANEIGDSDEDRTILVVGHAILLVVIAMNLCNVPEVQETLRNTSLGECQAIHLVFGNEGELVSFGLIG